MRTCIACHLDKEVDQFYSSVKRGKPYTMPRCKECHQQFNKSWYSRNKEHKNARSVQWMRDNHAQWREICSKSAGAYYHRICSPLVDRACAIFERMKNEDRRHRFALAILNNETPLWVKAKRSIKLDDWLGAYSGI